MSGTNKVVQSMNAASQGSESALTKSLMDANNAATKSVIKSKVKKVKKAK